MLRNLLIREGQWLPAIPALLVVTAAVCADVRTQLREQAVALEKRGEWEAAGQLYMRVLNLDRTSSDARQKVLLCLRHIQQKRRHADRQYIERISSLPLSRSLTAYLDALGKLQANYVDRDKIGLDALFLRGLEEFDFALDEPNFQKEYLVAVDSDELRSFKQRLREEWGPARWKQVGEVRAAVKEISLDAQRTLGVRPSIVVMEFLCGACNALDEHTAYLPPAEEAASYMGQLTALGVMLATNADGQFYIERVLPGAWAATTDLKEGDRIVRFIGKSTENGEPEQLAEIEVAGRGNAARRIIKMPALTTSVLPEEISAEGIGFLRITGFTRSTLTEINNALMRLQMDRMKALILDLRGNAGGLFPVAVDIAERFLPEGIIVTTQGQGLTFNRTYESHSGMTALSLPLFVLVDGDTASAAEVLAGALKENQRALLIGQPTYGKGTIQNVLQLSAGGGMRITLARFFTPRGQPYQGIGVTPDLIESVRPRETAHEQALKSLAMRND